MDATKRYKFICLGAMYVTKPYTCICFGAMDVTTPYNFLSFGAMDVTKPHKFICFGAMDATKPYKFKCFGAMNVEPTVYMYPHRLETQHGSADRTDMCFGPALVGGCMVFVVVGHVGSSCPRSHIYIYVCAYVANWLFCTARVCWLCRPRAVVCEPICDVCIHIYVYERPQTWCCLTRPFTGGGSWS